MDLPKELTITDEDLDGRYESNLDCPLARALIRNGVTVNQSEGYSVTGYGEVIVGIPGQSAGQYMWKDGTHFGVDTLRTGTLVLK